MNKKLFVCLLKLDEYENRVPVDAIDICKVGSSVVIKNETMQQRTDRYVKLSAEGKSKKIVLYLNAYIDINVHEYISKFDNVSVLGIPIIVVSNKYKMLWDYMSLMINYSINLLRVTNMNHINTIIPWSRGRIDNKIAVKSLIDLFEQAKIILGDKNYKPQYDLTVIS